MNLRNPYPDCILGQRKIIIVEGVRVQEQLTVYTNALTQGGNKLKNVNLLPRKELMEQILKLWK